MRVRWYAVPFLFPASFITPTAQASDSRWPCDTTELDTNLWLVSHHGNRSEESKSKRKLNEKNYGAGITATCGDFFAFQYDQLKNSQFGKTTVLGITLNLESPKFQGFFAGVRFGKARLTYEVPRYSTTLSGYTTITYFTLGYKDLRLHVAPVPKQSDVKIYFLNWTIQRW